jgi:hypothetical protein
VDDDLSDSDSEDLNLLKTQQVSITEDVLNKNGGNFTERRLHITIAGRILLLCLPERI